MTHVVLIFSTLLGEDDYAVLPWPAGHHSSLRFCHSGLRDWTDGGFLPALGIRLDTVRMLSQSVGAGVGWSGSLSTDGRGYWTSYGDWGAGSFFADGTFLGLIDCAKVAPAASRLTIEAFGPAK